MCLLSAVVLIRLGVAERMETCVQSRPGTPYRSTRSRSYETTYQREFSALKRSLTIDEGVPSGQRFLIGYPYQLNDPMGVTSYTVDYSEQKNVQREPIIRPNTSRANRPHPHPQFTHWPRRPVTASPAISEETKQALRNQFNSTYQTDYLGKKTYFIYIFTHQVCCQELLKDFHFHWLTIDHVLFGVIEAITLLIVNIDVLINLLFDQQQFLLDVMDILLGFQLMQLFHLHYLCGKKDLHKLHMSENLMKRLHRIFI